MSCSRACSTRNFAFVIYMIPIGHLVFSYFTMRHLWYHSTEIHYTVAASNESPCTTAYSLMRVCKQSRIGNTVLTMPPKCVTYWYLLLKGKSMPYRHNILYFVTVLAHLVHITKRAHAIILLSVCIIISINVITVIISVIVDVIVAIIVIADTIYVQPS